MSRNYYYEYMEIAKVWANASTCKRRKVGCVIIDDNGLTISHGYNGTPIGLKTTKEIDCTICSGSGLLRGQTCPYCLGFGKVDMYESDNNCEETIYRCPHCNSYSNNISKQFFVLNNKCTCNTCHTIFNKDDIIEELKTDVSKTVHAEMNAIAFAARNGRSTLGATIVVTTSPCEICSLLIAQAGIKRVVYLEEYRSTKGLDLLKSLGVEVIKYTQE